MMRQRGTMTLEVPTPPTESRVDPTRRQICDIHARLRCTEDMLNDQYSLFHNLYARENRWFSWLNILIIVFSSLMTFLSALDFLIPDAIRESGYDRIPNLVLSFLTTLICSFVKFFDFQSKLNDTREGAERTQNQIRELEVARERIETWVASDAEIGEERLEGAHAVLTKAVKHYHDNTKLLIKLPPELILKFEKQHQMRSLRRQKRQISRDVSRLFQKMLDKLRREVSTSASDQSLEDRLSLLIATHRQLLKMHGTITDYTNDFGARMSRERVEEEQTFCGALWARTKLVWYWCWCKQPACLPRRHIK